MFQSGVPGHVLLADASHLYSIIACIVFSSIACILLRGSQVPEKSGQSWRRPLRREGPCASIRLLGQENIAKTPRAKTSKTTPKHKCTYPETGKTICENSENHAKRSEMPTCNYCILRGFGCLENQALAYHFFIGGVWWWGSRWLKNWNLRLCSRVPWLNWSWPAVPDTPTPLFFSPMGDIFLGDRS